MAKETTMESTMCETGCGREATWSRTYDGKEWPTLSEFGTVHMCQRCADGGYPASAGGWPPLVRAYRRRSRSFARLR